LLLYFGKGIASMVISISVSYLFIQIVSVIYVRKMIPIRILHISNLNVQCGYCLLSFGGTVMGGSVLSMFLSPFNKLIIARYAGVSSVPIYEIAYNGSRQIRALFESPLKALIPEISRIGFDMTLQAKQKISQINTRAMKLILFFGVPTYSLIAVFTPFLLKIWFGTQLNESLPVVFRIMLIGSFFSLICVPAYYTLMGLGKVKYCFVSYLILCLTNVLIISGAIILCDTLNVPLVVSVVAIAMGLSAIYLIAQYSTIVAGITSKRVLIENGKTMHDKNSI